MILIAIRYAAFGQFSDAMWEGRIDLNDVLELQPWIAGMVNLQILAI